DGTPADASCAGAAYGTARSTHANESAVAARRRTSIPAHTAPRRRAPPHSCGVLASFAARAIRRSRPLRERRQLREPGADDRGGGPPEPALEHRRVNRAEVGAEGEIAHVQRAEVGTTPVESALHAAADQEQRRGFAVIGPAARVFRDAAAELAERQRQH